MLLVLAYSPHIAMEVGEISDADLLQGWKWVRAHFRYAEQKKNVAADHKISRFRIWFTKKTRGAIEISELKQNSFYRKSLCFEKSLTPLGK